MTIKSGHSCTQSMNSSKTESKYLINKLNWIASWIKGKVRFLKQDLSFQLTSTNTSTFYWTPKLMIQILNGLSNFEISWKIKDKITQEHEQLLQILPLCFSNQLHLKKTKTKILMWGSIIITRTLMMSLTWFIKESEHVQQIRLQHSLKWIWEKTEHPIFIND